MSRARRAGSARLHGIAAAALGGAVFVSTAIVGVAAPAVAEPGAAAADVPVVGFEPGRYIVVLEDAPAVSYGGGVSGLEATAPEGDAQLRATDTPVEDYTAYLEEQQEEVAATVGAEVSASYTLTLNAFAAELDAEQASRLAGSRQVAKLVPDEIVHPAAVPSTEFLGLSGDDGVWEAVGGAEHAGEGVVVGVLDTGIAPENPSFAGEPLGSTPGPEPYLDGDTIVFEKADGGTFTGLCEPGEQFTVDDCSTKIIGARYYLDGFGADEKGDASVGEYVSPRDGDGHGSHTASTAAGNHEVPASVDDVDYGVISGVAPGAKIAAYKVCWSGPDPTTINDDGCATSDLLDGIDQAVADGVDVINFSIGGGAAASTFELTDQAFFNAAAAGIFVSASAGNDGPGASTLDNASPWITTVAATTVPSYEATATFGDGSLAPGASTTVHADPATQVSGALVRGDLVRLADYPGDPENGFDAEGAALNCAPGSLDPEQTTGKIVMCERGVYDRVAKSAEVARAGGIGLLLVNSTPGSLDTDTHSVPTIHVADRYFAAISAYAGTAGATVAFTPGNTTADQTPVPQVAGFSSRGPITVDGSDILKPDIAAPGVSILADGANAEGEEPSFMFLSGTSMAAPHIAGLAALYLGERPGATPAEIKSAMMTTAFDTVDDAGAPIADPFAQGAGHVDPTRFFEPGLLYLNDVLDWAAYLQGLGRSDFGVEPVDASNLNLASISIGALTAPETVTRTVTSTQAGVFTPSVEGLAGVETSVEPSSLSFDGAGETASYTVTFNRTTAPIDAWATGSLSWTSGGTVVRSPIAVQPVTLVAPGQVAGTGVDGSVEVTVTPGGTGEIPLTVDGLVGGELYADPTGAQGEHSGVGSDGVADYFDSPYQWVVEVAEGTGFVRWDLDSLVEEPDADLDLFVYQLDDTGTTLTALWQSATGSADERVDLPSPEPGRYLVIAHVFSGNEVPFDLRAFQIPPGAGEGGFAVDPAVLPTEQGVPVAYTASWSGLAPESTYLGLVHYGDTGRSTLVEVVTGEDDGPTLPQPPVNTAAPTIAGTPEVGKRLTASPGTWNVDGLAFTYQWRADGVDIPNATRQSDLVPTQYEGASITVVVTASGDGIPPASAESAPVVIRYQATVSLEVRPIIGLSILPVTAEVRVRSTGDVAEQQVVVSVGGRDVAATLDARGRATVTLPRLRSGVYLVEAGFAGTELIAAGTSRPWPLVILF